jgi:5-hydroxyisourate hydrolase
VSSITTHVLDTASGRPAEGVPVVLERADPNGPGWELVGRGVTDADGRQRELAPNGRRLAGGTYRLTFDTGAYFTRTGRQAFFPEIAVVFAIGESEDGHVHVPLLLSPYGYSTYRGS